MTDGQAQGIAKFPSLRGSFGRQEEPGSCGGEHALFPSLRGSFGSEIEYVVIQVRPQFPSLRGSFGSEMCRSDRTPTPWFPSLRGSFGSAERLPVEVDQMVSIP